MPLVQEMWRVTGHRSEPHGQRIKPAAHTDGKAPCRQLCETHGDGDRGVRHGKGQQAAEEKKRLFKRSFWHPILSAQQPRTQGKSFQQINTTTKTRICTLNTTSIEMSTHCYEFHGWLVKNEGPVFWKSNGRHKYCFHGKSWCFLPI